MGPDKAATLVEQFQATHPQLPSDFWDLFKNWSLQAISAPSRKSYRPIVTSVVNVTDPPPAAKRMANMCAEPMTAVVKAEVSDSAAALVPDGNPCCSDTRPYAKSKRGLKRSR